MKNTYDKSKGESVRLVIIYECGVREVSTHALKSQALRQLSHAGKYGTVKCYEIQITH